jgi:hypothetical protein
MGTVIEVCTHKGVVGMVNYCFVWYTVKVLYDIGLAKF